MTGETGATRHHVCAAIARTLARSLTTARADVAMAEAIAIVEVAGLSDPWLTLATER